MHAHTHTHRKRWVVRGEGGHVWPGGTLYKSVRLPALESGQVCFPGSLTTMNVSTALKARWWDQVQHPAPCFSHSQWETGSKPTQRAGAFGAVGVLNAALNAGKYLWPSLN